MRFIAIAIVLASFQTQTPTPRTLEKSLIELKQEIEESKDAAKALRRGQPQPRKEVREANDRAAKARKRWIEAEAEATRALERANRIKALQRKDDDEPISPMDLQFVVEPRLRPIVKDMSLAEQTRIITRLAVERDALDAKIKRANKRWTCRILHIGCIGRK